MWLDISEEEIEYLEQEIVPWVKQRLIGIRGESKKSIEDVCLL
jgi:hypothetical protein